MPMTNTEFFISPLLGETPIYKGIKSLKNMYLWLNKLDFDVLFIISDSQIIKLHQNTLQKYLPPQKTSYWLTVPSGESNKNIENLNALGQRILDLKATRRSLILNFGGGGILNLGGLVASLLYRGIRFIHVPTTLMAQSDVVISNKQSINFHGSKNKWGCFSHPQAVFINYDFITTEPQRQINSALTEYCKNALILGEKHYQKCIDNLQHLKQDKNILNLIIEHSLEQKKIIAKLDPSEKQQGLVLEYGHTLGHALEYISHNALLHGEAVWIGLKFAGKLAYHLKIMPESELKKQNELLDLLPKPKIPSFQNLDLILETLLKDNKKTANNFQFIFIEQLGKPYLNNGSLLFSVNLEDLKLVLRDFFHVML